MLLADQNRVLELIATGAPLSDVRTLLAWIRLALHHFTDRTADMTWLMLCSVGAPLTRAMI